ncbi:MAG: hypothetical protein QXF12_00190 [Candidatus Aenigmatarchaeota archaeon]
MSALRFFSSFISGLFYQSNIYDNRSMLNYGMPQRSYSLSTGYDGSSGYPGLLYNQQTVEQYLAIMDMLAELFMFSVTGLAVRYISEAVLESMKPSVSVYVTAEDEKLSNKYIDKCYKYLDKIGYKDIIYRILPEFVYYGNYSFALDEDFNLLNLYDPYCAISLLGKNQEEIGYILNTPNGMAFARKSDSNIFRIGNLDMMLYSRNYDIKLSEEEMLEISNSRRARNFSKFYNQSSLLKQNSGYIREYVFSASLPLFYYSRVKLREYIIKDLIIMLITIRDLLFPTVLTLSHDYAGTNAGFQVVNLVDQLENILNSYVDIGGIIGVKSDLTRILNTLTYSIRVLPDYKGAISSLNGLDTSRFLEKVDRYKGDLTELLENILSDIGIPIEAFTSKSTYWESLRQSERFSSKVNSVVSTIENSFKNLLEKYLKSKYPDLKQKNNFVSIKLFDDPMGRISKSSNALETVSSYLSGSLDLIESMVEKVNNEYYNKEELINFIKTNLSYVISNIETIVNWEKVKEGEGEEEDYLDDEDEDSFYRETPEETDEEPEEITEEPEETEESEEPEETE